MCFGGKKQDRQIEEQETALAGLAAGRESRESEAFGTGLPIISQFAQEGVGPLNQLLEAGGAGAARRAAPNRAAITRRANLFGVAPDDPALMQSLTDFEAKGARLQEDTRTDLILRNELIKLAAAQGLIGAGSATDPLQARALLLQSLNT